MFSVAIDGPTGAGKSSIAKALAKRLNFIYVDTGALYRAIGYYALGQKIDVYNAKEVETLLGDISVSLNYVNKEQRVFLNREDVTDSIRTEAVSMAASAVSAHPAIRAFLLDLQRNLSKTSNVIMDGRDIGTVVLPNADVKIFLTATSEERAKRRLLELKAKGTDANYEEVLKDLIKRDYNDSNRDIAPLKAADDAVIVDTSELNFNEVLEKLSKIIGEKLKA